MCRNWLAVNFPWTQPRKLTLVPRGCAAKRNAKSRLIRVLPDSRSTIVHSEQDLCSEISRRFGSTPQTLVKFLLSNIEVATDSIKISCSLDVQYKTKAIANPRSLALIPRIGDPAKIQSLFSD